MAENLTERLALAWTALIGKDRPEPPPTLGQTVDNQFATMMGQWNEMFAVSQDRQSRYADFDRIDTGYIASMLRLMTFSTLTFDGNDTASSSLSANDAFKVEIAGYGTSKPAKVIEQIIEDTQLREWIYPITRDLYKAGDEFVEPLVSGTDLVGIWCHDASQMVVKRDNKGRLEKGTAIAGTDEVPLAYRQIDVAGRVLAGWYPQEILHLKFWPTMKSAYSAFSFLDPYRTAAKRVEWIEQAMVIARITRAYPRDYHAIDTSGKSPKEAEDSFRRYVRAYALRNTPSGNPEQDLVMPDTNVFFTTGYHPTEPGRNPVAKMNKIETHDPSGAGFAELGDVDHFQKQIFAEVPAENLGLSAQANKELTGQDISFSSLIKYTQKKVLEKQLIRPLLNLGLELKGFKNVPFTIVWPSVVGAQSWKMADSQFRLALAFRAELEAKATNRVEYMRRVHGYSEEQALAILARYEEEEKKYGSLSKADQSSQQVVGNQSASLDPDIEKALAEMTR